LTASAHARPSRALIATLLLAALVVLALWGPAAPTAVAEEREEAGEHRSGAPGTASRTSDSPRDRRAFRPDRSDSTAAGRNNATRGDRRPPREQDTGGSPALEHRSRSRGEAEEVSRLRESIRARRDAMRRDVRELRAEVRRKVRARAQALRRSAREAARPSDADTRSDRSRSREGASAGSDEARVSIAGRQRIELLPGRQHILRHNRALVRGYVPSGRSGRTVVLESLLGPDWVERDRALTGADGKFYLAWYPSRIGRFRVRVREVRASSDTLPSRSRLLYIYRRAIASWYGPGFYGNRTACGQTFASRLLGVAHRSLACGYRVTVRYRGRSITVPVVDRGPYVHGRDYDLTNATREYLDFEGVDEIWATA
jgi:rare lipoprotein A